MMCLVDTRNWWWIERKRGVIRPVINEVLPTAEHMTQDITERSATNCSAAALSFLMKRNYARGHLRKNPYGWTGTYLFPYRHGLSGTQLQDGEYTLGNRVFVRSHYFSETSEQIGEEGQGLSLTSASEQDKRTSATREDSAYSSQTLAEPRGKEVIQLRPGEGLDHWENGRGRGQVLSLGRYLRLKEVFVSVAL